MATAVIIAALLLAGSTGRGGAASPAWEKVFEEVGSNDWISTVRATSPKEFLVAGAKGVARVRDTGAVERRATGGNAVLGIFGDDSKDLFALGVGELVLHFDGETWTEEHIAPGATPRPRKGEDLLQSAFFQADAPGVVAFGPRLVLVRQADSTWVRPTAKERGRLSDIGQGGPQDFSRPPGCDPDSWFWLGRNFAWFGCQDGRTFLFQGGKVVPKGKKPSLCRTLTTVAVGGSEIYASCANGTLWKTNGESWRALPPPPDKSKAFRSISVNGGCAFVAGRKAVWRWCGRRTSDDAAVVP